MLELISDIERLDLEKIFGRIAPLHVDLGCGDGTFLCAMAERMPEKNFLGIERLLHRVRSATRKAPDNVRVLRLETSYVVRHLLPPGSVEAFYLFFPDPWPKRRHHRRRIVTPEFLRAIADALCDQGALHVTTDQVDYFEWIVQMADRSSKFERLAPAGDVDLAPTTFEKKYINAGMPIYRLLLRKVSPVM